MTIVRDGTIEQVCLVENPPYSFETLKNIIEEYERQNPIYDGAYERLYVKEHNNPPAFLPFAENIDYKSPETTQYDLYQRDFLAETTCTQKNRKDGTGCRIKGFRGSFWYY